MTRRGRPPLLPEDRKPRTSGPSGQHRRIEGDELLDQRRRIVADLPGELGIDVKAALPVGMAAIIAARLGQRRKMIGQCWRGERRYRAGARIF